MGVGIVNCRETLPLLPLFLDGELDARQMREVALHSTRCPTCEQELQGIERVQDLVAEQVNSAVEEIDTDDIWSSIAPRIEAVSRPWTARIMDWWEAGEARWLVRAPLYAGVAAALVLAALYWQPRDGGEQQIAEAVVDNSVIIDSVRSDVGSLALVSEPETNTMVLWVTEDSPMEATYLGGLP